MFQFRDTHILMGNKHILMGSYSLLSGIRIPMETPSVFRFDKQFCLLEDCSVLIMLLRVRHLTARGHVSGEASSRAILIKDEQLCFGCQGLSKSCGTVMQRLNINDNVFQTAWIWSTPNGMNQVSNSCFIITAKGVMKELVVAVRIKLFWCEREKRSSLGKSLSVKPLT